MKLIFLLLALCVGVVGIAAIVGSILPRDHVASMTVTVNASPIKVWTTITDVSGYPAWRTGVKSAEVISRAPLSWKEVTSMGTMTLVADEFQPPARMVTRITDAGPFGGEWEYRVVADNANAEKSQVTITERGWVSNVLFRFVSRFVMGHESNINAYLKALSGKFGSPGTPTSVTVKDST